MSVRHAARVLVVDEHDCVLLLRIDLGDALPPRCGSRPAAASTRARSRRRPHAERFYFVRVARAAIAHDGWQAAERAYLREHRWWSVDESAAATADASARFSPRRLAELLPPLLAGRFPDEPIDSGV